MSQIFKIFFVFILIGASLTVSEAQTTGKKKFVKPVPEETKEPETKSSAAKSDVKKDDEPSKWGFGVNIGNIGFAGDAVNIGLDPNVAYRIADNFAAGFMMKMNYYHAKYYDNLT